MTLSLDEAKYLVAQAEAEQKVKQKDDLRKKLAAAIKELEKKQALKQKVDVAVARLLGLHDAMNQGIQQLLAMISKHEANKPSHLEALPDCACKKCVWWRNERDVLQRSHAAACERKRGGTGDPLADTTLQRNLANEITTLERSVANIEAQLKNKPVGAQRLEGGLYGVR